MKKRTVSLIMSTIMLVLAAGCGGKKNVEYASTYLDLINTMKESGTADQFALSDIDKDGVPELLASSSEGSWDKDQEFVYTCYKNEPSLLQSDIAPGMEGHYIAFYEGENVIMRSGAATGESYTFYEIKDGQSHKLFSVSYDDMAGERYFIDDQAVTAEEYLEKLVGFYDEHGALTKMEVNEMLVKTHENGSEYYQEDAEAESRPYMSYEEITEQLKAL